jgi:hypothetical protein
MARGKYLSLEEARKEGKLDQFAKEHPAIGDGMMFDSLLERMTTPLKPGDYFLVVAGKMRVAHELEKFEDGSIAVDLYRNLEDYKSDKAMERNFRFWL